MTTGAAQHTLSPSLGGCALALLLLPR